MVLMRCGSAQKMEWRLDISGLRVDQLLVEWRWLCAQNFRLLTANLFGDLFLADDDGRVYMLDLQGGKLAEIADSISKFEMAIGDPDIQQKWFFTDVANVLFQSGIVLPPGRCFGYKLPLMFAEAKGTPDNVYAADIREYVSFLGDLHKQTKDLPNGIKVRRF